MDTAELTIAGIDAVKFYEKHHDRVNHVHFKDAITTDTLDEYKDLNAEIEYWPHASVRSGREAGHRALVLRDGHSGRVGRLPGAHAVARPRTATTAGWSSKATRVPTSRKA